MFAVEGEFVDVGEDGALRAMIERQAFLLLEAAEDGRDHGGGGRVVGGEDVGVVVDQLRPGVRAVEDEAA